MSKYTREFKISIAKQCIYNESSLSLSQRLAIPDRYIRYWAQVYRYHGEQAFIRPPSPFSYQDKYRILKQMRVNDWSISHTSVVHNMTTVSTIYQWQQQFEQFGLSGLKPIKRGRQMKNKSLDETLKSTSEMSLEELREELDYRRAENAYLKKLDALLAKKERQAKKKQGSSNN